MEAFVFRLTKACAGIQPNNAVSCNSLEEEEDKDDEGEEEEEEDEDDDDIDKGSPSSNLTKYSPTRLAPTVASASTKPPHGKRRLSPHCNWASVAASVAAATSPAEGGE
eukprot:evm.model.NODE_31920_length_36224_cov_28.324261.7